MSWKAAVAAGGAFSGAIVAGTVCGVLAVRQGASGIWIPVGLFAGLLAGAICVGVALRAAMRTRS